MKLYQEYYMSINSLIIILFCLFSINRTLLAANNISNGFDTIIDKNNIDNTIINLNSFYYQKKEVILANKASYSKNLMILDLLMVFKGVIEEVKGNIRPSYPNYILLRLVGIKEKDYPIDVLYVQGEQSDESTYISPRAWLINNGDFQPMFKYPKELLDKIKIELDKILEDVAS